MQGWPIMAYLEDLVKLHFSIQFERWNTVEKGLKLSEEKAKEKKQKAYKYRY